MISTAWPAKPVLVDERLAGHDRRARPVGGRRALQLGQRIGDHLRRQDVVERVLLLELRVRVVHRVLVILQADLREMLCGGAVLAHVLTAGGAEHPRRHGECELVDLGHRLDVLAHRGFAVLGAALKRAGLHLLEAERDRAVGQSAPDRLRRKEQRRRTRRTVVVHVGDRDAGHPELVECAVTGRRVARHIADEALLDLGEIDARVLQGICAGFACHVRVVPPLAAARLFKLRHPHTYDENLVRHPTSLRCSCDRQKHKAGELSRRPIDGLSRRRIHPPSSACGRSRAR